MDERDAGTAGSVAAEAAAEDGARLQPDGSETAAPRPGAFGRYLRQERELRGLGREEVARLTKLAPTVIEALESGDAARMPPRAYLVGYLRSYANAVGLDADDVVLRWEEVATAAESAGPARGRKAPARAVLIAGAVAAAIAVAAGIWAIAGGGSGRSQPTERAGAAGGMPGPR